MSQENKTIYVLSDYNWEKAELVSEGKKNYKIQFSGYGGDYTTYVPKEKCAFPGEKVAVIWERWKGRNGRGGYRVERELYPTDRIEAEKVHRQYSSLINSGRITETVYGEKE